MKDIKFNVELKDQFDTKLHMKSNSGIDVLTDGLVDAKLHFSSQPFYLSILDDFATHETAIGLSVEQAEEIVEELSKAIKFMKE